MARRITADEVGALGPVGRPGSRFAFRRDPNGNSWAVEELAPS